MKPAPFDESNIAYGRLLESAHISGYAFNRTCDELEWLLDDDRWRQVGPGFEDINDFLATVDLSAFNLSAEQKQPLSRRLVELGAKQRAAAAALGVSQGTVSKWSTGHRYSGEYAGRNEDNPDLRELAHLQAWADSLESPVSHMDAERYTRRLVKLYTRVDERIFEGLQLGVSQGALWLRHGAEYPNTIEL